MVKPVRDVGERFEGRAESLDELLRSRTREGELYEKQPGKRVRCFACAHRCLIAEGRSGVCRVRFNRGGQLFVPTHYAAGLQVDPIEKKPFFHALPGTQAFSFGMLGCDFHCGYCQNWVTSQTLRDPMSGTDVVDVAPEQMVQGARRHGAVTATSTYNEPLITSEWAVEVFKAARAAGMATSFVSNGNGTPEVLDYLRPWVDFYKVDLKCLNPAGYRQLGGKLEHVLETIVSLYERGYWVEIVTLVVPGFNDSETELRGIARFLAAISRDIPWHVTAFHSDYQMQESDNTSVDQIVRAARIGQEEGLRYVYAGNRPGETGDLENTRCPDCRTLLIEREGFTILQNNLKSGHCPKCDLRIPGVWALEDLAVARGCLHREVAKLDIGAIVAQAGVGH